MNLMLGNIETSINVENLEGEIRHFEAGEQLLPDKSGKHMGILTQGVAKLYLINEDGKERVMFFLNPLSIYGEVTMLTGRRFISNLSIQAVTPATAIFVTKENLERSIKNDPRLGLLLLTASCEKVSSLISHLNGSSFQDTHNLAAHVLLALKNDEQEVRFTHEELAEIIGRNRVTVSKTLLELQKNNIIEQKKRCIQIIDVDALQKMINPNGTYL